MTILENEFLKVAIDTKGAQLSSFRNKATGVEHMWQADAAVWPWHAPNLFPIVGQLMNDELLVDGEKYPMKRHGFARQSEFITLEHSDISAAFSLPNSENTLAVYPYKFDFQVLYTLIDNALRITYKVINRDKKPVYFSVGGHPAFNVPFGPGENYEDYYVEFESLEEPDTHLLSAAGLFNGQTEPVAIEEKKLYLTRDLFAKDALVFKNLKSRMVTIKSDKHEHSLSVEYPHFNYLGLWAKPGADFLCIEPWLGCADSEGEPKDIKTKEAIQKVAVGHVFEASFYVSV
ncbi:aldose 1-epimerase family protein [Mucilaginibacter psychrotolerans]|uniref:Aldose 1-epimerase family protein n=1 Tax=Mucilaginibacter psychrotolerans TaxID=1524096 RepID=A0A4Y8SQ90_9SPHI|nr:aldose 1-epimerase family protein [Mucilaginibacter psychrotolerans]TFF40624.1 aldose 1-epimerase family protein [Mucilaginibacter psychrotolerans]